MQNKVGKAFGKVGSPTYDDESLRGGNKSYEASDAEGKEDSYPRNTFFVAAEEYFRGLVCGGEDGGVDDVATVTPMTNVPKTGFGFSGGGDDEFGGHDEGEARLYKGVPEGEKLAAVTFSNEGVEGSLMTVSTNHRRGLWPACTYRLLPIAKTKTIMVRATTKEKYNTKDDQTNDCQQFYRCEPKLSFTKEGDSDDVQCENDK
ncbi:hypothetical protein KCU65_g368, partial [Aureobasidium melanogenum]